MKTYYREGDSVYMTVKRDRVIFVVAPHPQTYLSARDNFRRLPLKSLGFEVDDNGDCHKVECRRCPRTGIVLKLTERVDA